MVSVPQKKTINGNGSDRMLDDLICKTSVRENEPNRLIIRIILT